MKKLLLLLLFAIPVHAQLLSNGIIDPARAMDWTQAGIPGGLPDASWTQCGSTIAAYTGTAAAINTVISGCGANQYVLLGPGTFTLSTSIDFAHKSNFVLRGSGPNSTFLIFTVATAVASCNLGGRAVVGMCSTDTTCWAGCSGQTVYNWTAGFTQGSNQITLSSVASITPIGSGNPTLIFMTQDDTGYTGNPATGAATDNGNYFACADQYVAGPNTGCGVDGPDGVPGNSALTHNYQYEVGVATAVNSGTKVVTLLQPLKHPNWAIGQSPKVWIVQSAVQMGLENMSIDTNDVASTTLTSIGVEACYQCWVSGVRMMNFTSSAVLFTLSSHYVYQNNYDFNSIGSDSYGFRTGAINGDGLIQNNIFQKVETPLLFDGPDSGTVIGYNYTINNTSASDGLIQSYWDHSAGDDFHLWEGNIGTGFQIDIFHGTHLDETAFRNFSLGWDSCGNGQCGSSSAKDSGTIAFIQSAFNRYGNTVGNVFGVPGYHNSYLGSCTGNKCIYYKGVGDSPVPNDALTGSTSIYWSNFDVVTNAVRFCGNSSDTGWSTTCGSTSEIPTGAPLYPSAVPTKGDTVAGQPQMPPSFYLSSKPSWFGTQTWPPIDPVSTSGNLGQCAGTLNAIGKFNGLPAPSAGNCAGSGLTTPAWGGHVSMNPAMACAFASGMNTDGTSVVFAFSPTNCPYLNPSVTPPPPSPNPVTIIGATTTAVPSGKTAQFTATCQTAPCPTVTWTTNVGTITGNGLLTASPNAMSGTVTASTSGQATPVSFPVTVVSTSTVIAGGGTCQYRESFSVPQTRTITVSGCNGNTCVCK